MRAFVFLLILANLLFLAWTQGYFLPSARPDALRLQQQLNAERITIVARDEPPPAAAPEKPAPATAAATDQAAAPQPLESCLRLADLPLAEGVGVERLLAEQWTAFKALRTSVDGGAGFWVYIPPLANKQEVDNKVAELKRLRVPELFVVQESGANNRAISLGLFSTREAATARLEALRSLGVRSARVGERGARAASVQFEINGPQAQADALRQALADAWPAATLADCAPAASP